MARGGRGSTRSANERIQDEVIAYAVNLERVKASLTSQVVRHLEEARDDIARSLAAAGKGPNGLKAGNELRLRRLLEQVNASLATAYQKSATTLDKGLVEIAEVEQDFTLNTINASAHVRIATVAVPVDRLEAMATGVLIDGAPTREWWRRQAVDTMRQFERAVRLGMMEAMTIEEIVAKVRGTRAADYKDGVMGVSRRNAMALVRSSVQTVHNAARIETYRANADIIKAVKWISTLDARTTLLCKVRDGLIYTLEGQPIGHHVPWGNGPGALHWSCRSTSTPVLKKWDELGLPPGVVPVGRMEAEKREAFRKSLRRRGWTESRIKNALPQARASMDGQVPKDPTYEAWLKKKPAAFQKEMLGVERWKVWRTGKLRFQDLVDQSGRPLSVDDLRAVVKQRGGRIKRSAS